MKIIVLGAGLIGVSTAYHLCRLGHNVTVIDRCEGPALETSFANGGQLSASHVTPWANPQTPFKVLSWIGRRDAPLAFRLTGDRAMWRFFLSFLGNCGPSRSRANGLAALRMALYSRDCMAAIRAETDFDFHASDRGILHVFRRNRDLERAVATAERYRALGLETEDLNTAACLQIEPALEPVRDTLVGGIYSPGDMSGDAHAFTVGLAQACADAGVKFRLQTKILRLTRMGGRITGVMTDRGLFTAERYVMALGSFSRPMLEPLGIRLNLYPTRGYSMTAPVTGQSPHVSLTDDDHKIVVSRLGSQLRIAGMADFRGYDASIDHQRSRAVMAAGQALLPQAFLPDRARYWAGLRPLTPDGLPVIGPTPYPNLFLNTGHGTLGWTMACASGRVMADLVTGVKPDIDLAPYSADRF